MISVLDFSKLAGGVLIICSSAVLAERGFYLFTLLDIVVGAWLLVTCYKTIPPSAL